ncbi:MAG: nuclear transport factor 2 family protein [Bacteroidales bacterium]|nr:nuclear transport factor 2 family protein [Bacteroidales bacterium]
MKILALLTTLFCMQMAPDTTLEKEVNQYLDCWNAAMVSADTAALAAMMDEAIVLRHLSGATQTRSEWLADVQSGTMRYHNVEKRDVRIRQEEDGSIKVRFTSIITATIWGSRGTWTLHPIMRLVRKDGRLVRVE